MGLRLRVQRLAIVAALGLAACDDPSRASPPTPAVTAATAEPFVVSTPAPPQPIVARVTATTWTAHVDVDRKQLVPHEGFAEDRPKDAVDVKPVGDRVHHVDKVPDGFETVKYTEKVQDGYETERYTDYESKPVTETYTDRERCGESCSGIGSKRRCSPKYCNKTKTRTVYKQTPVTKTRQKPRYKNVEKTKQVPKFKDVERFAPAFSWRAWEWVKHRTIDREGDGAVVTWPADAELAPPAKLAKGEEERTARRLDAQISATDGTRVWKLATTEAELPHVLPESEIELLPPGYTSFRVVRSAPATLPSASASPSASTAPPGGSGSP